MLLISLIEQVNWQSINQMPAKSTRHWAKRKLQMARGGIDTAGQHVYAVSATYKENHPEISDVLDSAMVVLAELDNIIQGIERGI
jgi:hypothetical protein